MINIPPPEEWTLTGLRYTCRKNKVKGYTKMTRTELMYEVKQIIETMKEKN